MLQTLTAAYTGFSAARAESRALVGDAPQTIVHTGFWGCGAFGGNRRLMTVLQCLAGELAGVEVVFWAVGEPGVTLATEARRWYEQLRQGCTAVDGILDRLVEEKFEWGVSDGN
jgi:hypothetical protein